MAECLYLFPDTNLFIQCKELRQLDWSEWDSFEEVHLIVCRPVQREIDDLRNRRSSRVGDRARTTYSSLFRPIATRKQDYVMIQESDPRVKLFLEFPSRPDPDLSGTLNYDKADDEIVGCLSRYMKENPGADARLLTDDTGPMMAAQVLGLGLVAIDPDWKLPPENDTAEREIIRLSTELVRLKKQEPEFAIRCVDDEGRDIERLELVHNIYEPLDEDCISKYIDALKEMHPVETEFNQPGPNPSRIRLALALGQHHFEPASDQAIANYKEREYPQWLEDCRAFFTELHETLQRSAGWPVFRFVVANEGSRPGSDALIVIRAKGNLLVCPPAPGGDDPEDGEQAEPRLPRRPRPPRGELRASPSPFGQLLGGLDRTRLSPALGRVLANRLADHRRDSNPL